MKQKYDELAFQIAKETTRKYSTSFSFGIKMLEHEIRDSIYGIYGFVRLADEIVDSFHGFKQVEMLENLKEETFNSINNQISTNPIMHAFQATVNKYDIPRELIEQFLYSMEMDLTPQEYSKEKYEEYILGSAEVVGLMCLLIFLKGDKEKYNELKPFAMKLGSAFQKINFLRDLKDDYSTLGRTYFPNIDLVKFDNKAKAEIEKDIEIDFTQMHRRKTSATNDIGDIGTQVGIEDIGASYAKYRIELALRDIARLKNSCLFALNQKRNFFLDLGLHVNGNASLENTLSKRLIGNINRHFDRWAFVFQKNCWRIRLLQRHIFQVNPLNVKAGLQVLV